jgi:hypothetical protein
VFDKKFGVIGPLSEYLFISENTKYEKKIYKETAIKKVYPISVKKAGNSKIISIIDPSSGEVLEESEAFLERHFLKKFYTDPKFKTIFDKAVDISIQERIVNPFFNRSNLLNED